MSNTDLPARIIDGATGELVKAPAAFPNELNETPLSLRDHTWTGTVAISKEQAQVLRAEPNEDVEIDILPSGEIYMSHVFVRRRLSDAFMEQGGWKLRPMSNIAIDPDTSVMYREYALVVNGVAVSAAYGSTQYHQKNKRMDFADAAEAVRSNALTRCAKDLNIGSQCWDRDWCERWRDRYAVHVFVMVKEWDDAARKKVDKRGHQWRKLTRKPFFNEIGVVPDSPNYDAAVKQQREHARMIAIRKGEKVEPEQKPDVKPSKPVTRPSTATPKQDPPATGGESSQARSSGDNSKAATPTTMHASERGFYIKQVLASRETKKPSQIVMYDSHVYYTFHQSYVHELGLLMAQRKKVKIESENVRSGNRVYPHITEWTVMS